MAVFLGWEGDKRPWETHLPGIVPSGATGTQAHHLPAVASTAREWRNQDKGLKAVWSDGHTLQRSDSFDLKKWQEEFQTESARIKKHLHKRQKERDKDADKMQQTYSKTLKAPWKDSRHALKSLSRASSRLAESSLGAYQTSHPRLASSLSYQTSQTRPDSKTTWHLPAVPGSEFSVDVHLGSYAFRNCIIDNNGMEATERESDQVKVRLGKERRRHEREVGHRCRTKAKAWKDRHKIQSEVEEVEHVVEDVVEEEVVEVVEDKQDDRILAIMAKLNKRAMPDGMVPNTLDGIAYDTKNRNDRINALTLKFIKKIRPRGTLQNRMATIQKLRKMRKQQERMEKLAAARRARFVALPQSERDYLQKAFSHFDADRSGTLDLRELRKCLAELGLRGNNAEEKHMITQKCEEVALTSCSSNAFKISSAEIDFFEFVVELVPQIRAKLSELRRNALFSQFAQCDADSSGKLSADEVNNISKALNDVSETVITDVCAEMNIGQEVDFETFQKLISRLHEKSQREKREMERKVQDIHHLDQDTFDKARGDVVNLWQAFQRFDEDESGYLDQGEYLQMLKEFGLMPSNKQDMAEIEKLITDTCADVKWGMTFKEFLNLTFAIRERVAQQKIDEQEAAFNRFDTDGSGQLGGPELLNCLAAMKICPRSRAEQDQIRQLIELADDDGSGELSFEEFQSLYQRVCEKLAASKLQDEVELCRSLGVSENQHKQFRWTFDQLDDDGSNSLDISEVRTALTMLRMDVSGDQLREAFTAIDQDGSGQLEFVEFIHLMKTMLNREGIFADNAPRGSIEVNSPKRSSQTQRTSTSGNGILKIPIAEAAKEEIFDSGGPRTSLTTGDTLQGVTGVDRRTIIRQTVLPSGKPEGKKNSVTFVK